MCACVRVLGSLCPEGSLTSVTGDGQLALLSGFTLCCHGWSGEKRDAVVRRHTLLALPLLLSPDHLDYWPQAN